MIQEYVNKLIENLPNEFKTNEPIRIDLVLDGGIFNGSYLIGALFFLKEMEKRNYIKVERISGCSIGAITGFAYLTDSLHVLEKLYEVILNEFKQTYKLEPVKHIAKYFKDVIPANAYELVNKKLYINYYNIKKREKNVKNSYKDLDNIYNTITRSSYIPGFVDGNLLYENKYIDGINPYIFPLNKNTNYNKKILHLNLFGFDKVSHAINVKNESCNSHRILSGLLDIHNFFIKQSSTQMCSYVEDWTLFNKLHVFTKTIVEQIIVYIVYFLLFIKKYISNEFQNNIFYKIATKILHDIYIILLETYCF